MLLGPDVRVAGRITEVSEDDGHCVDISCKPNTAEPACQFLFEIGEKRKASIGTISRNRTRFRRLSNSAESRGLPRGGDS
jgi:hypothetical protein